MRTALLSACICLAPFFAGAQVLIQSTDGSDIAQNTFELTENLGIAGVSVLDQSLHFRGIFVSNRKGPGNFFSLGARVRPSDGLNTLRNGSLENTEKSFFFAFTGTNVLSKRDSTAQRSFSDYITLTLTAHSANYTLSSPSFPNGDLWKDERTGGFRLGISYDALFNSTSLLTFGTGIAQESNFHSLESIELTQTTSETDMFSGTTTSTSVSRFVRRGPLETYIAVPMRVAYTYMNPLKASNGQGITGGFSLYWRSEIVTESTVPTNHNLGFVMFTGRRNADLRVAAPLFAFGVEINDLFGDTPVSNLGLPPTSFHFSANFAIRGK